MKIILKILTALKYFSAQNIFIKRIQNPKYFSAASLFQNPFTFSKPFHFFKTRFTFQIPKPKSRFWVPSRFLVLSRIPNLSRRVRPVTSENPFQPYSKMSLFAKKKALTMKSRWTQNKSLSVHPGYAVALIPPKFIGFSLLGPKNT